jgi:hypothetical protein
MRGGEHVLEFSLNRISGIEKEAYMDQAHRRIRYWVVILVAVVLLADFALLRWYGSFEEDMTSLSEDWRQSAHDSVRKASHLAELERALGYAGFIHDFKNYVLRRTPEYEDHTEQSLALTLANLRRLQRLALSAEDRADIMVIQNTLNEYQKMFDRSRSDAWKSLSPAELDERVRVDDKAAAAAFERLRARVLPAHLSNVLVFTKRVEAIKGTSFGGIPAVLPVIVLNVMLCCLLLFLAFRRQPEPKA